MLGGDLYYSLTRFPQMTTKDIMNKYRLEGYNSGGYSSTREIEFDGVIEMYETADPNCEFPLLKELWYRYIYNDGRIVEDKGELLQELINKSCWCEIFTTQRILRS